MIEENKEGLEEFSKILKYRDGFKFLKVIAVISIIMSFIFGIIVLTLFTSELSKKENVIYVLDSKGTIAIANLETYNANHRIFEYKSHIIQAVKYLYELSEDNFDERIEKGLYYFGQSGEKIIREYTDKNFKQGLQQNNAYTRINISAENITINQNSNGEVTGTVTFIQTFKAVNVSNENSRRLTYEFKIIEYQRSDNNLHGCKIEPWTLVNQENI